MHRRYQKITESQPGPLSCRNLFSDGRFLLLRCKGLEFWEDKPKIHTVLEKSQDVGICVYSMFLGCFGIINKSALSYHILSKF